MNKPVSDSARSIIEASKSVANFSGHGRSLGAAGYRVASDHPENCEFLMTPGQSIAVNMPKIDPQSVLIGVAWDNIKLQDSGLLGKILKKTLKAGVDLDIGCLYELQNGERGAIQAFGEKFGNFESAPYISLSGDERTGDKEGHDEYLLVNSKKWPEIKRVLVYIYIYAGAPSWSVVNPQIVVDIPGENDFYVTLNAHDDKLPLCALAELENVRGSVKLTNRTEYFPGHEEMDRAFGFGLDWADGKK